MANQILIALLLASLAGLSTTVGSLIAFFLKKPTAKTLSLGLESIDQSKTNPELLRTGKLTALGVAIHNFPEGLFTFVGTLVSIKIGILLAIAVAMHNIPEGISVSFPIYWATGDIGGVILLQFLNETVLGLTIALVAGIMIFLSFDELLPVAHKHGESHAASIGVISGMIIMVITLILLT